MNTYLLVSSTLNFLAAAIQIGILLTAMERNPLRNRYLYFLVSLAAWSGFYTLWRLSDDASSAYFYSQMLISCAGFEPVAFLHFCLALSGIRAPRMLAAGYILASLFSVAAFKGLIVEEVAPILGHQYWPMAGKLMPLYLLHFNGFLLAAIVILIRGWRNNIGGRASDHMLVLISAAIGFVGGGTNFPLWYEIPIQPFGNILVSIYLFLMLHGIYKNRIFGLSIDFYKLLLGIVLNSSVTLFIMLFYGLYRNQIGDPLDLLGLWVYGIFIFFISSAIFLLVPKITIGAERILHGALRTESRRPLAQLSTLSSDLANIADEEAMFGEVTKRMRSSLKVSWVALFRRDILGGSYSCHSVDGKDMGFFAGFSIDSISPLVDRLSSQPDSLFFDHIYTDMEDGCYRQLVDLKNATGASLVVPIHVSGELPGMLLFGTFDRSAIPSTDALAVLSSVGSQIGLNLRIREFQRRASEVDKLVALGTMAAGLSHEIRNPLVSVQTLASLLKGGKSLAKVSGDYKEVLIRDIRRIEGIVDGVAAYSKNQKAHTSIISISEVITASISIYESQAKDKHVAINFDRKINPDVNVLGNFDQLAQVFNNLIENAIHAVEDSEERRVEISIRLEKSSRPAKWVAVTVADTGKGVPESIKDRVFDPFITSKDTGHREENVGMGLGLAISKRIVENHDGLITIADKRESGAMFVVSLKIHQSP